MSDLVQRLRTAAGKADQVFDTSFAGPWREAADEIERLRAALIQCRSMVGHPDNIALIDAALGYEQKADSKTGGFNEV